MSFKGAWHEMRSGVTAMLGCEDESAHSWGRRILTWLQTPVVLALTLLVPVVNHTAPRHGWCRPLNALHCLTCPLFCLAATQGQFYY